MPQLGVRDLDAALRFALQARAIDDLDAFRHQLVFGLRRLVACDTLGFNEIDLERRTAEVVSDAPVFEGVDRRFLELMHEHPLVPRQRRGDLRARLISDLLPVHAFHRLELYQDIYRPLGIEDQLALGLAPDRDRIVAINLARHRRTFTERDRELVELLRPHLALAYARACQRQRTRALMAALEGGLDDAHTGVIQLDGRGRVSYATPTSSSLLQAYFDHRPDAEVSLPARLQAWIGLANDGRAPRRLVIGGARGCLVVHEHERSVIDDGRTLLLEERPAGPPTLQAIRSLGLTDRQAQLLRLLAIGRTARQVASDLGISPGTVTKHLENIYTRLGVNTRAQALARIYDRHSPASGGGESVAPRPPTQRRMPVPVVARHRHQRPPARADLRAALNVALVAQAAESVKQLREEILPALRQLVPCDLIGYNEVDLERGNVLGDVHPAEGAFDGIDVAFARVAHQHPLVKRQQAGDLSAQLLSDSLSARQFHRLELYQDFYKLIGTEDQLAFGVPGEVIVAFALSASRPSFTSRDRQLLELVRPHLSAAYRHAREQDRARELVDTLQDALDALGRGLILLYARFEVAQVTETARALLDSYFRPRPVGRTGLPAALDAWIAACACPQRRPNQMTVDGPRGRLCIREQPTTANALRAVILEEQRPNAFELDSLREFGLTQRQAQVLRLVASGKSNGQTAAQLQISVGTVEKHLQHIYDRLGVGSRSQAIARIHEMVALTPGSQPC